MIDKSQKAQIVQILQMPQWKALEALIHTHLEKVKDDSASMGSEWEHTRDTLMKEGELRGIQKLMQEIYKCLDHNV